MKKARLLTFLWVLLAFSGLTLIHSCQKEETPEEETPQHVVDEFSEIQVPPGFDFQTTEDVSIRIRMVAAELPADAKLTVSLYNDYPFAGGEVMSKGLIASGKDFETTIALPTRMEHLWVLARYGEMVYELREVAVSGSSLTVNVGESVNDKSEYFFNPPPDCNSGCTISYPGVTNQNININAGDTVCIPEGAVFNGRITFTGGAATLKVCGTLVSTKIEQWSGDPTIIVSETGVFSCSNYQVWSGTAQFLNYGDSLDFNNSTIGLAGYFENNGDVYLKGFDIYTGGEMVNNGTMHLSNKLEASNNSTITNNGEIYALNHIEINSGSTLTNNCRIETTKKILIYANLENNGYMEAGLETELNGNTITLGAGSLMFLEDLEVGSPVTGPVTTYARLDVNDKTEIWNDGSLTNNIDICDADGIESLYGTLGPNVTQCQAYVPQNGDCNPGAGTPTDPDTDGDGVTDTNDDYPNDPDRAYNNYYPSENTFGTLAFEDYWPSQGDYDFNDLVLSYQFNPVTNAGNSIVEIIGKFKILATGAGYKNGFGFSVPIGYSSVSAVTGQEILDTYLTISGNGTEAEQNDAVIIVYDNVYKALGNMPFVNVLPDGSNTQDADTTTVVVSLGTPMASVGNPPYNPFLIIDRTRGREVHMIDYLPTDLIDIAYFGTEDDASNPGTGDYFETTNHLPWVINIPEEFEHMIEREDIITGYLKFVAWAESGGVLFQDWYMDLPGYRDNSVIYP
ncbi:MAG: LruC domain-containing protein [Bacteroidetes bacterium]|nr:LruC domain-containing protein [Bacteroidota bacterium]